MTVEQAWDCFEQKNDWFALIQNVDGELLGSVARAQVLEALTHNRGAQSLGSLLPETVYRIQEQAPLSEALAKMNRFRVTYLLVCRGDTAIGVIGSSDIVRAYKNVE